MTPGNTPIFSGGLQPFGFTGREYEPASELYHYRARAYDPDTGRFFQEDPIWFAAGDFNVHRYVWNNPLPAGALSAGDEIIDYNDGTPLTVVSVVYEETTERVYNFEVEGTHNYFAGDVGAWVHNASKFKRLAGGAIAFGLSFFTDVDENPFENEFRPDRSRIESSIGSCGGRRKEGPFRSRLNSSTSLTPLKSPFRGK